MSPGRICNVSSAGILKCCYVDIKSLLPFYDSEHCAMSTGLDKSITRIVPGQFSFAILYTSVLQGLVTLFCEQPSTVEYNVMLMT